jgi:hypothetical protein
MLHGIGPVAFVRRNMAGVPGDCKASDTCRRRPVKRGIYMKVCFIAGDIQLASLDQAGPHANSVAKLRSNV